jgi:hypothetical protein
VHNKRCCGKYNNLNNEYFLKEKKQDKNLITTKKIIQA